MRYEPPQPGDRGYTASRQQIVVVARGAALGARTCTHCTCTHCSSQRQHKHMRSRPPPSAWPGDGVRAVQATQLQHAQLRPPLQPRRAVAAMYFNCQRQSGTGGRRFTGPYTGGRHAAA
ncbi:hypothetical protein HU200_067200 [Digitaria exilis]|uniref:Uncharacterized protein n=1 Tax=Digitaria exilis TaxID=1010633 RepID=A0A835DTB4_9POAL|nr:hypothetical protein HU200_067200 [Digitaria exilis]